MYWMSNVMVLLDIKKCTKFRVKTFSQFKKQFLLNFAKVSLNFRVKRWELQQQFLKWITIQTTRNWDKINK